MDPVRNPYAPGAGSPPPELAGRLELLESGMTALRRVAQHRPTQSLIMVGLRGVGKTVLLNKFHDQAEHEGFRVALMEAHEGKSLPELLVPHLRTILFRLSAIESAKDKGRRGLRALKGLLNGLQIKIPGDFELTIDAEAGLADSGDIEADLPDLLVVIGEAAKDAGRPVALLLDELQYLAEREFSALIVAIHRINQRQLPVILIGAGLPQIRGLAGNSKSYAERLFTFPDIGALGDADAIRAIVYPARAEGVEFEKSAIDKILRITERYPYFLQQWAHEAWNASPSERITEAIVDEATTLAIRVLDQGFFKVRFDRCTPSERKYMRALAQFGRGKHRSGDIAEHLGVKVQSVAPTRSALIRKGMIYSPSHGDTAFTVPLFEQFMVRAIPKFP
jgi:hypothetical protein